MKKLFSLILFLGLVSPAAILAQQGNRSPQNESDVKSLTKKIEGLEKEKTRLTELQEKRQQASLELIKKAEEASKNVTDITQKRSQNVEDKELEKEAKKLEGNAKKATRQSQRADAELKRIQQSIDNIDKKIKGEQDKLANLQNPDVQTPQFGGASEADRSSRSSNRIAPPPPPVEAEPNRNDSNRVSSNETVTKVIEQSYKNIPNNSGQPPIIINNIIIPPSESSNWKGNVPQEPRSSSNHRNAYGNISDDELREFEAFKRWKANQGADSSPSGRQQSWNQGTRNFSNGRQQRFNAYSDNEDFRHNSFDRDRDDFDRDGRSNRSFDARSRHNSGLWLIPMVGVHASNFEADIKNSEATGQAGWNAGLDFRVHTNRFFVQPGVHYLSTSVDMVSKDSLSNDNFTSGPRIHSLKVPLLIGVYLTKATKSFFKFNVKGGVVGNYIIDVDKNNVPEFAKKNLNEYTYGINGGVGLEFGPVAIDISHEWGISDMFKNKDTKNNILRATLGLRL